MADNELTDSDKPKASLDDLERELQMRRSGVRIFVTRLAAIFVFGGTSILIIGALWCCGFASAKDIFLAVLPVATGVITYWFADRSRGREQDDKQKPKQD